MIPIPTSTMGKGLRPPNASFVKAGVAPRCKGRVPSNMLTLCVDFKTSINSLCLFLWLSVGINLILQRWSNILGREYAQRGQRFNDERTFILIARYRLMIAYSSFHSSLST